MNEDPQYQRIAAWVQKQRDDIIADLGDLVNIPSVADPKPGCSRLVNLAEGYWHVFWRKAERRGLLPQL